MWDAFARKYPGIIDIPLTDDCCVNLKQSVTQKIYFI